MKTQKKNSFVEWFFLGIIGVVVLIAAFFAFNAYIYHEKQKQSLDAYKPYRGTLTGEYICLTPIDTSPPLSPECIPGIKTETNERYAIDMNLRSQESSTLNVGDRFSATGLITPIENLSTDRWQQYGLEGIFSVTDSLVKQH